MVVSEAFSKGFSTYRKYFWDLLILSLSQIAIPVTLILASLIFLLPLVAMSGWSQMVAYGIFYALVLVAALFLVFPFFLYPLMSGSVLALRKKPKVEASFRQIKSKYKKLVIDSVIYTLLSLFLIGCSIALFFVNPFVGSLLLIASLYAIVRIYFWDVLLFLGEKHPIKTSWNLTEGRMKSVSGFLLVSGVFGYLLGLFSAVPFFGVFVSFLTTPFFVSSRVHFVKLMMKGFKKKRGK